MVAGSFKRQGNGILAAPALDRMNLMITRTKALGAALGHTEADYLKRLVGHPRRHDGSNESQL